MTKKGCGKNDIWFLRWGNLNPVKHKEARGASEDEWIHVAPCYKGIYAFPCGYVERFLISGSYGNHHRHPFKKDGKLVKETEFYDETWENPRSEFISIMKRLKIKKRDLSHIYMDGECYAAYDRPPKHFSYKGDIWHHLGDYVDKKDIKATRHGWYKTTFDVYVKALHKCDVSDRFKSYMDSKDRHGDPHTYPNRQMKDYYEVFIERVK